MESLGGGFVECDRLADGGARGSRYNGQRVERETVYGSSKVGTGWESIG